MNAFWLGMAVSVATGALVNEFCDVSPWLARRVMRAAALLWASADSTLDGGYVDEWASVLEDCPGKLTKLILALRFLLGAVARAGLARFRRLPQYLPAGGSWRTDGWLVAWLTTLTTLCSTVFSTSLILFGPAAATTSAAVAATLTTVAAAISYRGRSIQPEELEPA